ncbi:MAG: hypothetical protein PHS41_10895 [Victivallaceae bacterium]|nr:hypothetical protein [Victivallaceae bacterium]
MQKLLKNVLAAVFCVLVFAGCKKQRTHAELIADALIVHDITSNKIAKMKAGKSADLKEQYLYGKQLWASDPVSKEWRDFPEDIREYVARQLNLEEKEIAEIWEFRHQKTQRIVEAKLPRPFKDIPLRSLKPAQATEYNKWVYASSALESSLQKDPEFCKEWDAIPEKKRDAFLSKKFGVMF